MYSWVNKYVGIPFVSGGRDVSEVDCYGLVRLILKNEYRYGLPLLSGDYTNALCVAETKRLFKNMLPILCAQKLCEPREKSIVLMRSQGYLCHVGLYAGDGFIINAKQAVGVVCERINNYAIKGTIEGYYNVSNSYRIS